MSDTQTNTGTADTFDWGKLGEAWWLDTARQLGANDRQTRFAAAKYRGCSNTQAYREAGYEAANEGGYRTGGYRLARSNIIERLLAFASGEGDGYDGTVDRKEARRILSNLARGSDPSVRIRAIEQLSKMDEADRQREAAIGEVSMEAAARQLLHVSPIYGPVILADSHFSQAGTIWGMPYLKELAPLLKRNFHAGWQRYRDAILSEDHRKDFDGLSQGPLLTVEQIVGPPEEPKRTHKHKDTTEQETTQ